MRYNGAWLIKEIVTEHSAVEIYEKFHREKNSVFLDSAGDAGGLGRYSFIGRDPFLTFAAKVRAIKSYRHICTGLRFLVWLRTF